MAVRRKLRANKNRRTPTSSRSKLVEKLEAGDSIIGLKGFVPAGDCSCDQEGKSIFIAVKVLGLSVEKSEGVLIRVGVLSGKGEMTIGPADWVDTLKEVVQVQNKELRVEKCLEEFKEITKPHYLHERKRRMRKFISEQMTREQHEEFAIHTKEQIGSERIESANISQLNALVQVATMVVNNLEGGDVPDYRFRN